MLPCGAAPEEDIKNCSDIIKARMEGEGPGGAVGLSKDLGEEKKKSSGLFSWCCGFV